MEIRLGEFEASLNTKNGKTIIYPLEEKNEYKKAIKELMDQEGEDSSILLDNEKYQYETITICLNVTKTCNLACKYCFNKNKQNTHLKLEDSIAFIEEVVNKFPDALRFIVDLSGSGEPLLELDQILLIAK